MCFPVTDRMSRAFDEDAEPLSPLSRAIAHQECSFPPWTHTAQREQASSYWQVASEAFDDDEKYRNIFTCFLSIVLMISICLVY